MRLKRNRLAIVLVALLGSGFAAAAGWDVSSLLDTFLVVLVFGVGTDYAIFLISRYREEVSGGGGGTVPPEYLFEPEPAQILDHLLPQYLITKVYAALLESRGDADGEAHDSAALIRQASERAAALTRQLLAFGRRQAMRPQVVDANVVVSELCRMLRRTVPETIHLRLSTSPNPAPVLVDPVQMEQVLMNLVLNARDAMPEGGELRISVVNLEQPPQWLSGTRGPCVLLRVADTGLGMDAETKGRVFEPFFTTKPSGTGLGLAIVRQAAEAHGGAVEVESAPGGGALFRVKLPAAEAEPPHAAARVAGGMQWARSPS